MNEFQTALFVKPGRVLGHQLKPLSAFHASSLLLLGSPYLTDSGSPTWGDTVTAVLICISSYDDGLDKVLKFQNSTLYRAWWRVRLLLRNHSEVATLINEHIDNYFRSPGVWEDKDEAKSKRSGAPWWFFCISLMWMETGAELSDLWNMSLSELFCHKAIRDEVIGGAEISTGLIEEMEQAHGKN